MANEYIERDDLKDYLFRQGEVPSSLTETALDQVREVASRGVDRICGRGSSARRRFYAVEETRYFPEIPHHKPCNGQLWVPDILSITTLKTDEDNDRTYERTWASTDYELWPYNAAVDGQPYARIDEAPQGDYSFPSYLKSIQVTGSFGFCEVDDCPPEVLEATRRLAGRLFKLRDAPLGLVGAGEFAMRVGRQDPEILHLLGDFIVPRSA